MKPVVVPAASFTFCRYTISVLVWVAWWRHSVWWLALAALLLALSAVLKVGRAPLIVLYSQTVLRLHRSKDEVLDETAMRFAHLLGTAFALACLGAICFDARLGWRLTFVFALLKTAAALGFCPAGKLFTCATNTTCCPVTKRFFGLCQSKPTDEARR
jgi:hypothetical protein